jgi:hypothetical protein
VRTNALACRPGVLSDACGGVELERDERARLRNRSASVALECGEIVSTTARWRLTGGRSFIGVHVRK